MMAVLMDNSSAPSARDLAQHLYKKNIELENGLRKSVHSRVPSDPNAWLQMRDNYETIILEDHDFSEKHEIEYVLWQLHYKRIEEFRAYINAAASTGPDTSQGGKSSARPDRIKKIRSIFKSFLSEATGFYHDLILKIRAKYGLPLGYFSDGPEGRVILAKDENKSGEMKKGLLSCHRCLIYLGDLARYKGVYGEGDSVSRDYAAASSYYLQAASLFPSSGNPHHQLAILASYSGDDLVVVYRYFRSLAVDSPFSTARDNLIIAFEKNRQSCSLLPDNSKFASARKMPTTSTGRGRDKEDARLLAKDSKTESSPTKDRDLSIPETFKAFSTRFVRLNGILFTRTSLETFEEIFSLVISDLHELLSSGPEEELNFGQDVAENGLLIVRFITILIFTVHNVNRESEGLSYAEILQRRVLLQNAFTAAFEFVGRILKRCVQLRDIASCYLLPANLVFIEWLACHPDIATGFDVEEKQATARSFFWNQCASFLNKLMLSGLGSMDGNEDENCFFDLSRYDEGETVNRLALWEDFELRGFLPLVPAQLILDFSRKHSFVNEGSMREKRARVQRIIAAGRALTNVLRMDQHGIFFDPTQKKFVIGSKPLLYKEHKNAGLPHGPESFVFKQGNHDETTIDRELSQSSTVEVEMAQSKAHLYAGEEEEEEEEIVFKPLVIEKCPNSNALKSTAYEIIQPLQISSKGGWATYGAPLSTLNNMQKSTYQNASPLMHTPARNVCQQTLQHIDPNISKLEEQAILDGLNNLNIIKSGLLSKHGFQEGVSCLQPSSFSPLISAPDGLDTTSMFSGEIKVAEPVIPSSFDSIVPSGATFGNSTMNRFAALPTTAKKTPVSRPVKHLGPPPGFSHVPSKQQDDPTSSSVIKDQHLHTNDFSWLDGYQSPSTEGMGMDFTNHTAEYVNNNHNNTFTAVTTFPFPGKQVSTVQTQAVKQKWQDFQLFEQPSSYPEQKLQRANLHTALLPEQHQAQSIWSVGYFV